MTGQRFAPAPDHAHVEDKYVAYAVPREVVGCRGTRRPGADHYDLVHPIIAIIATVAILMIIIGRHDDDNYAICQPLKSIRWLAFPGSASAVVVVVFVCVRQ